MSRHYKDKDIDSGMENLELDSTRFLSSLDPAVRRRVEKLKSFQGEKNKIAAQFEAEVQRLEKKYWKQYEPIFTRRFKIVNGQDDSGTSGPKGIPRFWLLALKNHPHVSVTISARDEGALKQLVDVRAEYLVHETGFQLFFHFAPNEYFSNSVLSKTYYYKADASTGLSTPDHSKGDKIDWKRGKNLTVKVRQRKKKDKRGKQIFETEEIPTDSFFEFFTPPTALMPDEDEEPDQSDEWLRTMDFEIGEDLKDEIIPRAVNWYTGEAAEDFEDGSIGDTDEEEDSDDLEMDTTDDSNSDNSNSDD